MISRKGQPPTRIACCCVKLNPDPWDRNGDREIGWRYPMGEGRPNSHGGRLATDSVANLRAQPARVCMKPGVASVQAA
mgnify:CR=1 FL=1